MRAQTKSPGLLDERTEAQVGSGSLYKRGINRAGAGSFRKIPGRRGPDLDFLRTKSEHLG
jgi:hypothetical protein